MILNAQRWIWQDRDVLKTRLLDLSPSLHSEVDRPDAEATFRIALWPPLAALALYLASSISPWWLLGLVVPPLLAWQGWGLRRTANDALATALAARPELSDAFGDELPYKPGPGSKASPDPDAKDGGR